jgi:PPK2 family polyphosphate:nucleotide phosphotransferase
MSDKTPDWKTIDAAVTVSGAHTRIADLDTQGDDIFPDKAAAEKLVHDNADAINALQDRLFAERRRAVLVVLQGTDTSGKDGTVRGVFNTTGPLGVTVTPFGRPSEEELAHDYLWRIHAAIPKKGFIGIFNRSHYEDVLVVKVRKLAPADVVSRRYEEIVAFEKHLTDNNVTILKFMLHISKEAQKERLEDRLQDPAKRWKWNGGDLEDRKLWGEYQSAYETVLQKTSSAHAPWRVIPADRKWRRNAIISTIVRGTLEDMDPQYPVFDWKPEDFPIP